MLDMLLGGPGETPQTVAETVRAFKQFDPDCAGAALGVRIYPGTAMAAIVASEGPMETNAAIGSQMRPDPYNVLEMRIDQYLNELVHPVAITLQRFRGRGLKTVERLKELWLERCQREKEKEERGE